MCCAADLLHCWDGGVASPRCLGASVASLRAAPHSVRPHMNQWPHSSLSLTTPHTGLML